jgi:hypothetical protein
MADVDVLSRLILLLDVLPTRHGGCTLNSPARNLCGERRAIMIVVRDGPTLDYYPESSLVTKTVYVL